MHQLYGHEGLRHRLAEAHAGGRLPHTMVFEGPQGVGKQRLALWLAQQLVCDRSRDEPCGECQKCRLLLKLSHPDVHWFIPIELSDRSGDADKKVEAAEEALAEALQARRERSLYSPPAAMAAHSMASVRLLLRRLNMSSAMGGPKMFILGDAERLRPQLGVEDAPNALLKALEEPPANTYFVLTTSDATALLPSVLSRAVRVRVSRVSDSVVVEFAHQELKVDISVAKASSYAAFGCIGRLIAHSARSDAAAEVTQQFLASVRSGGPADRYARALAQPPFEARGGFTEMVDALLDQLRDEAVRGGDTSRVVAAIARLLEVRALARGNVNPQLLAAVMAEDLAEGHGGSR